MASRSVLVIDDSPTIHKVVKHSLKNLGFEVLVAGDGPSGIDMLKQAKPKLVLLDFMMPGMNGYQVCKELTHCPEAKGIPIVLMSTKGEMIGEKLVRTMGIVDFITKPFHPEALATLVQHVIDSGEKHEDDSPPLLPVGERRPDDPATSHDLQDPRGRQALRGELGMVPLAEVFQLLKFQASTGILHVARGKAHLEVFLREGQILFARASNVDKEFLLGRFLVASGAISPVDLELFLESRKSGKKLLGEQLVKLGHLTSGQLAEALQAQTAELLYEALRWGEGEFAFYVTEKLPEEARQADVDLSIDKVLLEGFRRVDEWGLIEKEIRDFSIVLAPARDSTGVVKQINLNDEEKQILSLVDGERTIRDIVRHSHRSSFDVCKMLYRLLGSRIVRKRSRSTAGKS